jgi:hypothetical protein
MILSFTPLIGYSSKRFGEPSLPPALMVYIIGFCWCPLVILVSCQCSRKVLN